MSGPAVIAVKVGVCCFIGWACAFFGDIALRATDRLNRFSVFPGIVLERGKYE